MTTKGKVNTEEVIIDFLTKFSESPAEAIIAATGLFKLNVYKTLNRLTAEGKIEMDSTVEPALYSVVNNTPETSSEANAEVEGDELVEKRAKKTEPSGRDTTKYKFQGQEYGKGQLVLAVVRAHVEANKRVTLTKLKEVFPDELQPRYGMIQDVPKAKKLSEGRERFFLKPEQVLKVGDKKVAVCNQWGSNNIDAFLKIARSLGYTIKK